MSSQWEENQKALREFRKQLEALGGNFSQCSRTVVARQANEGMAKTKEETPKGEYPSGKQGGTLRRGWTRDASHREGQTWVGGYHNNVEYGMYVNNGHRVVNKEGATVGYVSGKRMLEKGITRARQRIAGIFEEELARVKKKAGF